MGKVLIIKNAIYYKRFVISLIAVMMLVTGCSTNESLEEIETSVNSNFSIKNYSYINERSKTAGLAFSENGYYYIVNCILHFYDYNSSLDIPVCSKINCSHNSSSCDAYILDSFEYDTYNLSGVTVECLGNTIWYNSGNIYMIKRDESGDYLMQYDKNFSSEVKYLTLANEGEVVGLPSKNTENTVFWYKEYLYYYSIKPISAKEMIDYKIKVYCNRIKIEKDAKVEILGEFDMAIDYGMFGGSSCGEISAGNELVYFVAGGSKRLLSDNDQVQYRIGYCNCDTGEFKLILDKTSDNTEDVLGLSTGNVYSIANNVTCVDDEDNLYIVTDKSKIVKILSTGQAKVIYANPLAKKLNSVIWDGEYIYMFADYDGRGAVLRIDKNGNESGQYEVLINKQFCEKYNIRSMSGKLPVELTIRGIDSQNIIVSTINNYITGLECENWLRNPGTFTSTYTVGIISKNVFSNPDEQIKKIYTYE